MSTWHSENFDPSRPFKGRAGWELSNMIKALEMMSAMNTPEEDRRLAEAKRELRLRRKAVDPKVHRNPMRWSLYGGMENVGYSVLGRPIDKRSTAEAKAKAWSKLAHYPVEVKSGRKVISVYVKGRKVRSNPLPAAAWAAIEAAPMVYAAGEATYHAGRAGYAAYRKYKASRKKRSRR